MHRGYLGALLPIALACGCSPIDRLKEEVASIKKEAGTGNELSRVFVLLAPDTSQNRAYIALQKESNFISATVDNVTAIVTSTQVSLYHRDKQANYKLVPRRFVGPYTYFQGGRDAIFRHFIGQEPTLYVGERLVVADENLITIDAERPSYFDDYPTLFSKYGGSDDRSEIKRSLGSSPTDDELPELRQAIRQLLDIGGDDPSVNLFVLLPSRRANNYSLGALDDPKNAYLATHRNVFLKIMPDKVVLRYRGNERVVKLPDEETLYGLLAVRGGRTELCKRLTGLSDSLLFLEHCVIADPELNPIEVALGSDVDSAMRLLAKYSKYSQEDFERWSRPE